MNPVIQSVIGKNPDQGEYDTLPTAVQQYYTPRQYSFLPDHQKAEINRLECEPDA